jgi:hypothetical protein
MDFATLDKCWRHGQQEKKDKRDGAYRGNGVEKDGVSAPDHQPLKVGSFNFKFVA